MKLSIAVCVSLYVTDAKNIMGTADVARSIRGDWVNQFYSKNFNSRISRRDVIDGEKGFRPMAAMKLYLSGFGSDSTDPEDSARFETEIDSLEAKYTKYGCYCWINGMDDGVIGGGKTKDATDHHCKELYRCYKCVNNDYSKNYTDVSYSIDFTTDSDGNRELDCSGNSKQDGENICQCDKRFAEALVATENACDAGWVSGDDGDYCMDESYRTEKAGGAFDPKTMCDKQFHGHDKDHCCGFYPNRYPYDINEMDCCRVTTNIDEIFSIQQKGVCSGAGGDIVVSVQGDPHNYSVISP